MHERTMGMIQRLEALPCPIKKKAGLAYRLGTSFPSWLDGFDSRIPLFSTLWGDKRSFSCAPSGLGHVPCIETQGVALR